MYHMTAEAGNNSRSDCILDIGDKGDTMVQIIRYYSYIILKYFY